jgi:hypothetical protein
MKMMGWIGFGILFLFSIPTVGGQKKPATQDEESRLLGRVVAAIEDVGAGEHPPMDQKYIKEALSKFSSINKDIEKREYSLRLRWTFHYWYGKALLDSGDAEKAVRMLEIGDGEAASLTSKEREQTAGILRSARQKLAVKRPG